MNLETFIRMNLGTIAFILIVLIIILWMVWEFRHAPLMPDHYEEDEDDWQFEEMKRLAWRNAILEQQLIQKENCIEDARRKSQEYIGELTEMRNSIKLSIPQSEASEKLGQRTFKAEVVNE